MSGPPLPPSGWTPPPPAGRAARPGAGPRLRGLLGAHGRIRRRWLPARARDGGDPHPARRARSARCGEIEEFGVRTWALELDPTTSTVNTLLSAAYFIALWAVRGQTLGMMLFNLRIVRAEDGTRLDVVSAVIRYLMLIISFAVIFLGVIFVAFDRHKQGWHDKLVRTVVVRPS